MMKYKITLGYSLIIIISLAGVCKKNISADPSVGIMPPTGIFVTDSARNTHTATGHYVQLISLTGGNAGN